MNNIEKQGSDHTYQNYIVPTKTEKSKEEFKLWTKHKPWEKVRKKLNEGIIQNLKKSVKNKAWQKENKH